MNGQNERSEEILLDRLVDGELTEVEYRQALQALESQPDGWRRCSLAFLEAQAWGREARAVRAEIALPQPESVRPRRGWSWFYAGAMALSSAASFLLAFGLAMRWQDGGIAVPTHEAETENRAVSNEGSPLSNSVPQLVSNSDVGPAAADLDSPVGRYRVLVDSDSAQPKAVEMPVFAADDPRAGLLLDEYSTQPRELIRALERRGNQVHHHRNWIPMPGSTTGPVYVPVDEFQVTPVSSRSFH